MKTLWLLIALLLHWQSPRVAGVNTTVPTPALSQIGGFAYGLIKIPDINNLFLIPNYASASSSQNLISQNNCLASVSGGFYGQDLRPLGLLIINGQTLNRRKQSDLFDGFLSIDEEATISARPENAQIVLQSGPLLIRDGQQQQLKISSDKSSRRMIAAISGSNLIFLTVFNPQAEVLGPYLEDLPKIVVDIGRKENLSIDNALNLDGGRASAFYNDLVKISESDPVGSLFCVK